MGQAEAEADTERFLLTRECLYYDAVEKGFSVTEKEVKEYINNQIEAFEQNNQMENFEDYQFYLDGLGMTSKEYWNSQYDDIKKEMTTWKYLEPIYKQFLQDNNLDIGSEGVSKKWADYQNIMADKIAEKDNVIKIEQN